MKKGLLQNGFVLQQPRFLKMRFSVQNRFFDGWGRRWVCEATAFAL